MDEKKIRFVTGFLSQPEAIVSGVILNQTPEKQMATINMVVEVLSSDRFSDSCLDMLHTIQYDGRGLTEKQFAWFLREAKS